MASPGTASILDSDEWTSGTESGHRSAASAGDVEGASVAIDDGLVRSESSKRGLSAFSPTGAGGVLPPTGRVRAVHQDVSDVEEMDASGSYSAQEVARLLAATHLGRRRATVAASWRQAAREQLHDSMASGSSADAVFLAAERIGVQPGVVERAKQRLQELVRAPL